MRFGTMPKLREGLTHLPKRMRDLPVDERGYPCPWFIAWIDGKPEFRAIDPAKKLKAIQKYLCWICGEKLGQFVAFVAGPMCGISRTSAEPPCHLDCARWAARNCPFLIKPHMSRRVDEKIIGQCHEIKEVTAENPGVAMVLVTLSYVFKMKESLGYMGTPEFVEWWTQGRPSTRTEVMDAIARGLPLLWETARAQDAVETLEGYLATFLKFIPA